MITVKQQSKLMERIKSLSELELDSFFKELSEHLRKSEYSHLIDRHFENPDLQGKINDLEENRDELEKENEEAEEKLSDIQKVIYQVEDKEEFEEDSFNELKRAIDKINKIL